MTPWGGDHSSKECCEVRAVTSQLGALGHHQDLLVEGDSKFLSQSLCGVSFSKDLVSPSSLQTHFHKSISVTE